MSRRGLFHQGEPGAAAFGSGTVHGKLCPEWRAADVGGEAIHPGSEAGALATRGSNWTSVPFSSFGGCRPSCLPHVFLPRLVGVSNVLTTILHRGHFARPHPVPFPHPLFGNSFPHVVLGGWTRTVAIRDWPGVTLGHLPDRAPSSAKPPDTVTPSQAPVCTPPLPHVSRTPAGAPGSRLTAGTPSGCSSITPRSRGAALAQKGLGFVKGGCSKCIRLPGVLFWHLVLPG